ncbi:hypothetical protein EPUS_08895 [Endocarpon pusillum Z07020]|uniref:Defect at low temperature protein 1 n=1 Tax=Endocarpon pusillum (strain Z07020 / HMAS-L-300199) TaxID=1263415 RepID=U1GQD2_ENDPU|nr:uncharacterized protein EPUS_08895 [Endocarpon pusillum Z07020]ERF74156.1 hypothetical protein EPUS_08895 [Endocarpon pusillum Z07020]
MRAIRPLLFRIFYSTSFTVVFLLVLTLVALTPADAVYQARQQRRQWDIGAIAGTYILTALLAILIYASRLYTNRSIVQGIPKTYIPIEKEDLPGKLTREEIVEGLERSAIIAYKARPRFDRVEDDSPMANARISAITRLDTKKNEIQQIWGHIAHPGWSSPASPDLPNLHYDTVIAELPNLIEAKAVSLAPIEPHSTPHPVEIPLPDERVVEILQRPLNMGLREYIAYLDSLGLISPPDLGASFLTFYERARFSTKPLTEFEFRSLMSIFASILRGMTKLDRDLLAELQEPDQNDTPTWQTPGRWSPKSASTFSVDGTGSIRHHHPHPPRRVSEDSVPSLPTEDDEDDYDKEDNDTLSLRTAPFSQPHADNGLSKQPPRTRLGITSPNIATAPANLSLRQTRSNTSAVSRSSMRSAGSVIRLVEARTALDLPYRIEIPQVLDSSPEQR